MSRVVPAPFQAHLNTRATTTCLCWLIAREDGVVMGFTDHDVPLTFGGVTYLASTSFTASAVEDQLGLAVSNLDIAGAISSDVITNDDLEAGRYDNAAWTIYLVNHTDVTQRAVINSGTFGQGQYGDLAFQVELRSLAQHFAQYIGSLVLPKCRSLFGDTGAGLENGCNFSLPAPVPGVIASVTNRTTFVVTASGSFPDGTKGTLGGGYFAFGTVKFTSGANIGLSKEIAVANSTLHLVTCDPFPLSIAAGDAVEIQIGCDKTLEVCRDNYDNIVNRRAEDYVPGTDTVFQVHT